VKEPTVIFVLQGTHSGHKATAVWCRCV